MSESSPTPDQEEAHSSSSSDDSVVEHQSKDESSSSMLKMYEELFADRYTDKDKSYVEATLNAPGPPPAVYPWYSKPRRNFDYSKRSQFNRDDRNDRNDHRRSGHRDHDNRRRHHHREQRYNPYKRHNAPY